MGQPDRGDARPFEAATILVHVGLDHIGDGLMKLPFVRALRRAWPKARITWLAGHGRSFYASTLAPAVGGLIDEVIEEAGIRGHARELFATRPLAGRRFDLVLDTQRRALTSLALRRLRHERFVSQSANFLFSDMRPAGAPWRKIPKPPHMVEQLLALLALARHGRLDAAVEAGGALRLPSVALERAAALLPSGETYIALVPGAGGRHKCWPLERYIELARRQTARGRVPVLILGPQEGEWLPALRDALPSARLPLAVLSAVEARDPILTIALAARCRAGVANDSGGGHMMAAADLPLVSLFGPTPPAKFRPWTGRGIVLKAQDFADTEAMEAIPLEAVCNSLDSLLAPPNRGPVCAGNDTGSIHG